MLLDELTLECPLCECRSECVDMSAGTRNLFTHGTIESFRLLRDFRRSSKLPALSRVGTEFR